MTGAAAVERLQAGDRAPAITCGLDRTTSSGRPAVAPARAAPAARRRPRRPAADDGFIPVEWLAGTALLLLPTVLLLAVLPMWAARHEAAQAAAREAARVAVLAEHADPVAAGSAAGAAVLADRGLPLARVEVVLPPAGPGGALPREGVVAATAVVAGHQVDVPGFGVLTLPEVRATHQRPLDPYRSR